MNQNRLLGAIFIAIGLVNLVHPEYLDAVIYSAIGGGLLLDADESPLKRTFQISLAVIALVLLIGRLIIDFKS